VAPQVNLKLFQPAPGTARTVLLIVIRDRTRTPFPMLCNSMRADLDAIWASLVKPPEHADARLDAFFDLQYVSLPSFEAAEDDFRAEATLLRRRFAPSEENCLLPDDRSKVRRAAPRAAARSRACVLRLAPRSARGGGADARSAWST
jgi:protein SEY1